MADETSAWTSGIVGMVAGTLSFVVSWGIKAVSGGWKARDIMAELEHKISASEAAIRDDMRTGHDEVMRVNGEAIAALRQHVQSSSDRFNAELSSAALWGRDNYVQQRQLSDVVANFNKHVDLLSEQMRAGFDEVKERIREQKEGR